MKRERITALIVLLLAVSTLAAGAVCYKYLKGVRTNRFLQGQVAAINHRRAGMQAMAIDLNEYARRNQAIEPLLEKLNLRMRGSTNQSGARP